ncbi:NAD-dependent epimerase/dehydratase family protein [Paenibacillaceae bacterium WGS1546]|uniref:NAD-dependent epimerase/dehydratase family protein n=1 Tax=Cohnella sp. WGS1546 TaxID=3366810 RepID=UPI00372D05FF
MNVLVTGAAGFIGSHLCEKLLKSPEHRVIGIDGFIQPRLKPAKERNLRNLLRHPRFTFVENSLQRISWKSLLPRIDAIYHLAGMPGVRTSWGTDFKLYIQHNIAATQRLLEACVQHTPERLIYASTSSVYGHKLGRVAENAQPEPLSPYGVSKLTGEHLCRVYGENFGIPFVILRYFTVYGPRQREDMAFHRFIRQLLHEETLQVNGDGTQTRDFTYVEDCIEGTAAALDARGIIGETINIGGKERASVLEVIALLEQLSGMGANVSLGGETRGEPKHTWADISKAEKLLGYRTTVGLKDGLRSEWNDLIALYGGG